MNHTVKVEARRWKGGWELWLDGEPITQVRVLAHAPNQVRDYLDTVAPDVDHKGWNVEVTPVLGGLGAEVAAAKAATQAAANAQAEAAAHTRKVVADLRGAGVSVTDCAFILGVSRGRISQLAS